MREDMVRIGIFQYPLCRIDSCHQPCRLTVGAQRFFQYPLCRIDSCHGATIKAALSVMVFQYPLCRIDSCHLGYSLLVALCIMSFSIRSAGSIHATAHATTPAARISHFQYPLCRIDSCHIWHSCRCCPRRTLSVSALPDRFMPPTGIAYSAPCSASFSIRSAGSIHATR